MEQKEKKLKDLPFRLLINGIGSIILAFFIIFAEFSFFRWIFVTFLVAISSMSLWEYNEMVRKKGFAPSKWISISGVILYLYAVFLHSQTFYKGSIFDYGPEIILGVAFILCFIFYALNKKDAIANISTTFFGLIYIGIPMGLIIYIVYLFDGRLPYEGTWWLVYLIAVTKSADMGGYFIGRFGKRKLALRLSPNKTLEGALGGLATSVLMSVFLCFFVKWISNGFTFFTYWQAVCLGVIMGLFGQFGDLAESLLKRDANIKDSNTLPGVGGILDMLDSLLFTSPLLFIFLKVYTFFEGL